MMKPYQYKEYEKKFFINLCKGMFEKRSPLRVAMAMNSVYSYITKWGKFNLPMYLVSLDGYLLNGIVRFYIAPSSYIFPFDYGSLKERIIGELYQIKSLVIQCNSTYVNSWYIIICGELGIRAENAKIYNDTFEMLIPFFLDHVLTERILRAIYQENNDLFNEWKKPIKYFKKYEHIFEIAYPRKTKEIELSYFPPNLREKVSRNYYRYKSNYKISSIVLEDKIYKGYERCKRSIKNLYDIDLHFHDKMVADSPMWEFLTKSLIIKYMDRSGKTFKETDGFIFFTMLKIRNGDKIYLGDYIKLCRTLNI